jgi:hypothetical protein
VSETRDVNGRFIKGSLANPNAVKNLTYRFPSGNTPWNKGMAGLHLSPDTQFVAGSVPWNKGKTYSTHPPSIETRAKISAGNKGRKWTEEQKQAISNSMKNLSPEVKLRKAEAVSRAQKGRISTLKGKRKNEPVWNKGIHTGHKSANYKGGISKIDKLIRRMLEYRIWRSNCFERDKWTCQTCRTRGVYITVHHIRSVSSIIDKNNIKDIIDAAKCDELWDENNGVTLCEDCHKLTDNYSGRSRRKKE